MGWVLYSGHEWRERLPLRVSGYVCAECGSIATDLKDMRAKSGTCKVRVAPMSWLPEAEQTPDKIVLSSES